MRYQVAAYRTKDCMEDVHDEEAGQRYEELSQKCNTTFYAFVPNTDQAPGIYGTETTLSQESGTTPLLSAFTLLAARYASIDAILSSDIQRASSLLDEVEEELTVVEDLFPAMEADVRALEELCASLEARSSVGIEGKSLRGGDVTCIQSWVEAASRCIEKVCPTGGEKLWCRRYVMGDPVAEYLRTREERHL